MSRRLAPDDVLRHFDETKHVRFRESYAGLVICLECQEIDASTEPHEEPAPQVPTSPRAADGPGPVSVPRHSAPRELPQ
jgi:hypothetical protein